MIEQLLKLLRESESTAWVAEQIEYTLSQGKSETYKEAAKNKDFFKLESSDLSKRDRTKRESYETTRSYTEVEARELIVSALRSFFVDIPWFQSKAFKNLNDLGIDVGEIQFVESEKNIDFIEYQVPFEWQANYSLRCRDVEFSEADAVSRFNKFLELLPK